MATNKNRGYKDGWIVDATGNHPAAKSPTDTVMQNSAETIVFNGDKHHGYVTFYGSDGSVETKPLSPEYIKSNIPIGREALKPNLPGRFGKFVIDNFGNTWFGKKYKSFMGYKTGGRLVKMNGKLIEVPFENK